MSVAIQTENLTRRYGDHVAVRGLNLVVPKGEIFGFLGHNGAGKTTTISMLTTLLVPTAGSAKVFGHDVVSENLLVRQHIGYVPENIRMYNDLTVAENLAFFAALSNVADISSRVDEVLELVGHPEWHDARVGGLSKGMRQRIGIAQALLHKPGILFLDEPASGLDPEGTFEIGRLLTLLNGEHGITMFMNTHRLAEATKLCTSIGVMNHGKLVLADTLQSLLERFPNRHSLEEIYLGLEAQRRSPI